MLKRIHAQLCAALFGDQQNAAGFTIQPVYQLQKIGLRAGHAQLLDHAKTDARPAVYRHSGGLVDNQHVFILKQDRQAFGSPGLAAGGLGHGPRFADGLLRNPHRRQANRVACLDAGAGLRAPFVDPDFPAADDAVDVGFGHAFELAHQKIVQSLAGGIGVHCERLDLPGGRRWRAPYNVFH